MKSSDKVSVSRHQINAEYASGIRRGPRATNRVNWVLYLLSTASISEGAPTVEVLQLSPDWLPRASSCAEIGMSNANYFAEFTVTISNITNRDQYDRIEVWLENISKQPGTCGNSQDRKVISNILM